MFLIPDFYVDENMNFDEAVAIVKGRAGGDLLEGMKAIEKVWEGYLADQKRFYNGEQDEMVYGDDNDFYDHWHYEVNAFNVVFENMKKLF